MSSKFRGNRTRLNGPALAPSPSSSYPLSRFPRRFRSSSTQPTTTDTTKVRVGGGQLSFSAAPEVSDGADHWDAGREDANFSSSTSLSSRQRKAFSRNPRRIP